MKFTNVLTAFLALILLVSFTSALTLSTPSDLTTNSNTTSVSLTNNNGLTQNVSLTIGSIISGSDQVLLSVSPTQVNNLAASASSTLTVSISNILGSLDLGEYTATLSATGINSTSGESVSNATATVTYVKSFCSKGQVGSALEITNIDLSTDGDDDETWKPLDEVQLEIDVENNDDDDIDDVFVEIGLFDSTGSNKIGDMKFDTSDEEEFDIGTIKDGDEETVTFTFIVPADFDDGNYKLAVKAYSDDTGESADCTDTASDLSQNFFQEIDVEKEDDEGKFMAFDNIEVSPSEVTCGDTVTVNLDVFNVGEDDEDQVRVNLESSELNVDLSTEIRQDLDSGDDTAVSFTFTVPNNIKDKTYTARLSADYDYRNGNYRESSEEDTLFPIVVVGCTPSSQTPTGNVASISASLESEAKAGEQMVVTARITNTGSSQASFAIDADGYSSWATLDSISTRTLSLTAGQSKEVTFTFNINDDASDSESFTIEAVRASDNASESREVAVNIESKGSAFSLPGNSMIWIIGAINVILIILIIVVAVRISRR